MFSTTLPCITDPFGYNNDHSNVLNVVSNAEHTHHLLLSENNVYVYVTKCNANVVGVLNLNEITSSKPTSVVWNNDNHIAILTINSLHIYRVDSCVNDHDNDKYWSKPMEKPVEFIHIKTISYVDTIASDDELLHMATLGTVLIVTTLNGHVHVISWRGRVVERVFTDDSASIKTIKTHESLSLVVLVTDSTNVLLKYSDISLVLVGEIMIPATTITFNTQRCLLTIASEQSLYTFTVGESLDMNEIVRDESLDINGSSNVINMSWNNKGDCICVLFENNSLEFWTIDGFRTYATTIGESDDIVYNHLVWGTGDFHLFYVGNRRIIRYNMIKRMHNHMILLGSEQVILWHGSGGHSVDSDWEQIEIPKKYLDIHWPIKLCRPSSQNMQHVCVAGDRGFALYNRNTSKWKCFSNVSHEKQLQCVDVCWIGEEFVLIANAGHQQRSRSVQRRGEKQMELLLYSRHRQLSNACIIDVHELPSLVLCMSVERRTVLVHLCNGDLLILDMVYTFETTPKTPPPSPASTTTATTIEYQRHHRHKNAEHLSANIAVRHHIKSPFQSLPRQSCLWRRYCGHYNEYITRYVLLDMSGTLFSINLTPASSDMTVTVDDISVIASNIHSFTLSPLLTSEICRVHTMHMHKLSNIETASVETQQHWQYVRDNVTRATRECHAVRLYTFSKNGVYVWVSYCRSATDMNPFQHNVPSSVGDLIALKVNDNDDVETLSLGIDCESGVLISVTNNNTNMFPRLVARLKPILPPLLTYLIACECVAGHHDIALRVATDCRWHSLFDTSLELVLHECLQWYAEEHHQVSNNTTMSNTARISDLLLHRVLYFIKQLPEYHAILVNTARKVDVWQWRRLFSMTQSPTDLLLQCLKTQQYTTASHYLLLVQRTEGVQQARHMAIRILNDSIISNHGEDIELTRAITQFLQVHHVQQQEEEENGDDGI